LCWAVGEAESATGEKKNPRSLTKRQTPVEFRGQDILKWTKQIIAHDGSMPSAYYDQKNREKYEKNISNIRDWIWSGCSICDDFMKNWWSCRFSKGELLVNIRL